VERRPAGGRHAWPQWHGGASHTGNVGFGGGAAAAPVRGPGGFYDTTGNAHGANIAKVAAAQITGGYPDGTFRPGHNVTRAQMAAFLQRGYELPAATGPSFPDVAGSTHEPAVRAVAASGITSGDLRGLYRPSDTVTRGQMAAFIARAEHLDLDAGGPSFGDIGGHAFEREIRAVAAAGIANGSNGNFNPTAPVTRGQMATFLANALGL
jgi:hypothetical protein